MLTAPLGLGEEERFQALLSYEAFQTAPEPQFDRITSLASRILGMPMALVTLIGEDTQWLKSCFGISGVHETPREVAFCAHTIVGHDVLVVPDATLDPRFSGNPFVIGDPHVRFYAGAPLCTPSGHHIGALCVLDSEPRAFTPEMQTLLRDLAALVVNELELRKHMLSETSRQKQDAEMSYLRLADAINGVVYRVKQSGPQEVDYLYVSKGSIEMLGVAPETFLENRTAFIERVHPEDLQCFTESIRTIWETGHDWSWTGRIVSTTGSVKWVNGEGRCGRTSDGTQILEGLLLDITERMGRKAALERAKEEAERANQAKSEFLSRMSHELRTPMNAILGFTQILEMEIVEVQAREDLAQIRKAGGHLLELINEVLDLSAVDNRKVNLSIIPVPLSDVIAETTSLLGPMMRSQGIRLRSSAPQGGVSVLADPHRLKQIVINLLTNAVKYNRPGGDVTLEVTKEGGEVLLAVSDEGGGISPEDIGRLFTPFDRLGAEATAIEGTGLGLTISRRLVELMGGSLSVSSVLGEGSTFTVSLPEAVSFGNANVDDSSPEVPSEPESPLQASGTREVLYVEDNDSNILLVQRILGARPLVHLTTVKTVTAGLERLAEAIPGILLVDLNLPDGSGEAIIQWVRTESDYKDLPIIVLSADAMPGQAERILAAGADHYLTKPLDVASFLQALDDAIEEPRP